MPDRKPDLVLIKKTNICHLVNFAIPANHKFKTKENEMINKYLDLAKQLKSMGHVVDGDNQLQLVHLEQFLKACRKD